MSARSVEGLRVTKLRQDDDGIWRANVSLNGSTIPVQRSPFWQEQHDKGESFKAVHPEVAAQLQKKLPRAARGRR